MRSKDAAQLQPGPVANSVSQAVSLSVNQAVSQSVRQLVRQSMSHRVSQSASWPIREYPKGLTVPNEDAH